MSSYTNVSPQALTAAADGVDGIIEGLADAGKAAEPYLHYLSPAGLDETSAAIAKLFAEDYRQIQILLGRWNSTMDAFMSRNLRVASSAYAAVEAAAKHELDVLEDEVVAFRRSPVGYLDHELRELLDPRQVLLGRPLFGDGANAP